MRISALAVMALEGCAALAARAEDTSGPAEVPAATAPQTSPSAPAATAGPDSKNEKQLPAEAKSDKAKDSSAARFGFQRVDDGFLRFDYQTGQVAYCNARSDGWGCQPVPENRAALEREVEQLRAEVADLKNQLKALTEPPRLVPPETVPPSGTPKPPNADKSGDMTFSIPGREHIARAANAVQEAWQHFVDLVVGFTNDIRRKSGA
jgi:hypothetical protein